MTDKPPKDFWDKIGIVLQPVGGMVAALALGLFLHGITLLVAIGSGAWFRRPAHGPSAVPS